MKIVVMSDSHHYKNRLSDIIAANMDADAFVFLGDGINDFYDALAENGIDPDGPGKQVVSVMGNCDRHGWDCGHVVREFGGIRYYITHGCDENVKMGVWTLMEQAKAAGCSAALYGHTHSAALLEKNGMTFFNPGSAAGGKYGIIEIRNGKAEYDLKDYSG